MTPPYLVQIECPGCQQTRWIIGSDYPNTHGERHVFEAATYSCPHCRFTGAGWAIRDKSPSSFFIQPHAPMSQEEFDKWVAILRANFPDHPRLAYLGTTWYPRLPKAKDRPWTPRAEPLVVTLRDQSSSKLNDPKLDDVLEWIGVMKPGGFILLQHGDGGSLRVEAPISGRHAMRCDAGGETLAAGGGHDLTSTLAIVERYLAHDMKECTARIRGEASDGQVSGPVRRLLLRKFGKRT